MAIALQSVTLRACALAALTLALFTPPARAQFNGPALGNNDGINRPLTPTTDPAILYPADREQRITSGDALSIRLLNVPDAGQTSRVAFDGTVEVPLIGPVQVEGLSPKQAGDLIAARLLAAGMYRNPQVAVTIAESPNQVVTVTGEMHGVLPLVGHRRLLDVLSASGGLPPTASHLITINRPGVDAPIVVDLGTDPAHSSAANIPIFPGDTIVVSRRGSIYLIGAIKINGAIPLQQNTPLTMLQVLSLSGGTTSTARMSDAHLVRTNGVTRTEVKIDMKKILNGKAPDPILQADDIIIVPNNALKAAFSLGGLSAVVAITTSLFYILRTN